MTPEKLTLLLSSGRALNMVQVTRSRTRRRKGYRLFVVDFDHRILDVTATIARVIKQTWNNADGTLETNDYESEYMHHLGSVLRSNLGLTESIAVLTL
jgi:hypothetical protein